MDTQIHKPKQQDRELGTHLQTPLGWKKTRATYDIACASACVCVSLVQKYLLF